MVKLLDFGPLGMAGALTGNHLAESGFDLGGIIQLIVVLLGAFLSFLNTKKADKK